MASNFQSLLEALRGLASFEDSSKYSLEKAPKTAFTPTPQNKRKMVAPEKGTIDP